MFSEGRYTLKSHGILAPAGQLVWLSGHGHLGSNGVADPSVIYLIVCRAFTQLNEKVSAGIAGAGPRPQYLRLQAGRGVGAGHPSLSLMDGRSPTPHGWGSLIGS
jgi:hypothetical protein